MTFQQGPVEGAKLRCISLGAGVQSTTLALMAAAGEIGPMPDCAIFADTQWESESTYQHLAKLCGCGLITRVADDGTKRAGVEVGRYLTGGALPFPTYIVTAGDIRAGILTKQNATGGRFASVPWYVKTETARGAGLGRRQCTKEYKLEPITKEQRRLLGAKPRARIPVGSVEVWVGISLDETVRMKPAWNRWQVNRWPLIELRMRRADCEAWLARAGWVAPRSACVGCPMHNNSEWRRIRDEAPAEWQDAVMIDNVIRMPMRAMKGEQFAHRDMVPLEEVDLSTAEDHGQGNLFLNECEGMCNT